jgi:hypothetical protein
VLLVNGAHRRNSLFCTCQRRETHTRRFSRAVFNFLTRFTGCIGLRDTDLVLKRPLLCPGRVSDRLYTHNMRVYALIRIIIPAPWCHKIINSHVVFSKSSLKYLFALCRFATNAHANSAEPVFLLCCVKLNRPFDRKLERNLRSFIGCVHGGVLHKSLKLISWKAHLS